MNTAEMWIDAQTSGLTYKCTEWYLESLIYSKNMGLVDKSDNSKVCVYDLSSGHTIEEIMSLEWEAVN